MLRFWSPSLCDWPGRLALHFQPIRLNHIQNWMQSRFVHMRFPAFIQFGVFTWSPHWLMVISSFVPIGSRDYLAFDFEIQVKAALFRNLNFHCVKSSTFFKFTITLFLLTNTLLKLKWKAVLKTDCISTVTLHNCIEWSSCKNYSLVCNLNPKVGCHSSRTVL